MRSPRRRKELIASHIKKINKCLYILLWGRKHMLNLPTRKEMQFQIPKQKSTQERYCEYMMPTKMWNSFFLNGDV